jgi:L-ascorbate metabolism protein UlaG (beta-lactamase superfamily)
VKRALRPLRWLLGAVVLLVGSAFIYGCALSAPAWKGPKSDHFDGDKFFTPGAPQRSGVSGFFKWQVERKTGTWSTYRDEPFGPPPPVRVGLGVLRVTFINHATTLLQLDGVNVLTDPIYSERASPVSFAGPHRVRPPGIRFDDLPPIDAVVLSHNHYDHMDVATLKRLQQTYPRMRIFAGLGNKAFLERQQLHDVFEMDWWQSTALAGTPVTLTSVPNQHFSNRGLLDADATLWTGWVLEGTNGRAYFGGDTGYGPHFKAVGDKLGPFRLAVLPIGAYLPEWFMGPIHMNPADALKAKAELRASVMVPIHYGTFPLADDGETQPVEELRKMTRDPDVWVLGFGEGREVPQ